MSKSSLKILAVVLGVLMLVVYFMGLDGLPRALRSSVDSEVIAWSGAQAQLTKAQDEVLRSLQTESDLFRGVTASRKWPELLSKDLGDLQLAAREMERLRAMVKQNRRKDRQQVESLLAKVSGLRTGAVQQATAIQEDAAHWVDVKRHLPDAVRQMERDYATLHNFDLAAVAAATQKAAADWPGKQTDLNARLATLRDTVSKGDSLWQTSEEPRRLAAANSLAGLDIGALIGAAEWLQTSAAAIPKQAEELKSLDGQLYNAWDKVLVDMEVRGGKPQQKLRTVQTRFASAEAKSGEITSSENWVEVSQSVFDASKNNLGMAIAHKAAGEYDVEADRVAQPPGFAYMASPAQGRNQYGYWERRNGQELWVFYGQYALMRDLLFNNRYQPIDRYDYDGYRTYQLRRETYYGNGYSTSGGTATSTAQRYGTQGSTTRDTYSGTKFSQSGGFKDSKFATKSGGYSESKYATPSGDRTPRQFGSGSGSSSERRASPPSRPAPRSSPSRPSSSPRRFGKR